ncbi:UPF0489 protein C5orf22-like [Symbiodinium microadriaticum]|uniref:UPF0489 protein C5orf22-like n=1 Tax=Symbiodinium microadriaticum TaxID=2951 RepID=A0A1Q9CBE7_SYMMI|nr:UPF0489 protein C5orf22-like [Symbiodinium microadriaticum]
MILRSLRLEAHSQPEAGWAMSNASAGSSCSRAPEAEAKRRKGPLPVFVCEYHDEALRFLHFCIRRRKIPFGDLAMVHLDAHPDLSASTQLEADRIYDSPLEVYAALREEDGGIAQWILPAVYGGHLSSVWWVRPPGSQQISDGTYRNSDAEPNRTCSLVRGLRASKAEG